mmetsp:Transcript_16366/g.18870  ORF Transcript_16366/g.18870 Transcript_16366/m.18870 type:complete len:84 (-) Transcript_16366:105-356(-)
MLIMVERSLRSPRRRRDQKVTPLPKKIKQLDVTFELDQIETGRYCYNFSSNKCGELARMRAKGDFKTIQLYIKMWNISLIKQF